MSINKLITSVIYVEDDATNRFVVERLLGDLYQADIVETPEASFALAKKQAYDVALIDLNLNHPKIDGFKVLEEFQKNENFKHTLFIAHTNYYGDEWKTKCLDAGFDYFYPKPFDLETFESILSNIQKLKNTEA
jgi:CheY-like chemotaxis protein